MSIAKNIYFSIDGTRFCFDNSFNLDEYPIQLQYDLSLFSEEDIIQKNGFAFICGLYAPDKTQTYTLYVLKDDLKYYNKIQTQLNIGKFSNIVIDQKTNTLLIPDIDPESGEKIPLMVDYINQKLIDKDNNLLVALDPENNPLKLITIIDPETEQLIVQKIINDVALPIEDGDISKIQDIDDNGLAKWKTTAESIITNYITYDDVLPVAKAKKKEEIKNYYEDARTLKLLCYFAGNYFILQEKMKSGEAFYQQIKDGIYTKIIKNNNLALSWRIGSKYAICLYHYKLKKSDIENVTVEQIRQGLHTGNDVAVDFSLMALDFSQGIDYNIMKNNGEQYRYFVDNGGAVDQFATLEEIENFKYKYSDFKANNQDGGIKHIMDDSIYYTTKKLSDTDCPQEVIDAAGLTGDTMVADIAEWIHKYYTRIASNDLEPEDSNGLENTDNDLGKQESQISLLANEK